VLFDGLTEDQIKQLGLISEAITAQASKGCPSNPCDE